MSQERCKHCGRDLTRDEIYEMCGCEGSRKDQRALEKEVEWLKANDTALGASRDKARQERDALQRDMQKCWEALGITNYREAQPLAIWEHIARLSARAASMESALRHMRSRLQGVPEFDGDHPNCLTVIATKALTSSPPPQG